MKENRLLSSEEVVKKIIAKENQKKKLLGIDIKKEKKAKDLKYKNIHLDDQIIDYSIKSIEKIMENIFEVGNAFLNKQFKFYDFSSENGFFLEKAMERIYNYFLKRYGILGEEIANKKFDQTLKDHILEKFHTEESAYINKEQKEKVNLNKKDVLNFIATGVVLGDRFERFMRFVKWKLVSHGRGIAAFITDDDFIESNEKVTRRKEILDIFDDIYIYNFRGDKIKKTLSAASKEDENILGLKKNIILVVLVKYKNEKSRDIIKYKNLWGLKKGKLNTIKGDQDIFNTKWKELIPTDPYWFFVKKDTKAVEEYIRYWDISDIFPNYGSSEIDNIEFKSLNINIASFDNALDFTSICVSSNRVNGNFMNSVIKNYAYKFPLIIESINSYIEGDKTLGRKVNLNPLFIEVFSRKLKLKYEEKETGDLINTYGFLDIFYYIYSIFFSKSYRKRYSEQLEMDFPRIPLTKSLKTFKNLKYFGKRLATLHLFGENPFANSKTDLDEVSRWKVKVGGGESKSLEDWRITAVFYDEKEKRIYVNSNNYFSGIDEEMWKYKVSEEPFLNSWLINKQKTGEKLSLDDLMRFLKLLVIIRQTIESSKEIDKIIGKWPIK